MKLTNEEKDHFSKALNEAHNDLVGFDEWWNKYALLHHANSGLAFRETARVAWLAAINWERKVP